jgi:hypothetical protein
MSQFMSQLMCQVAGCRFKHTHVTSGHQCGTCKAYGHGQRECSNPVLKTALQRFLNDRLPDHLHCSRPKCVFKDKHITSSHICSICKGFHSTYNCPSSEQFIQRKDLEETIRSKIQNQTNQTDQINQTNQTMVYFDPMTSYDDLYQYFYTKFAGVDGKIYHTVYAGMGCYWILRRDNIGELIEIRFAHSDDHYCPDVIKATDDFINGYLEI